MSKEMVTRASCRVAWADRESAGPMEGSVRQKRRRLARTYQFDKSSTIEPMALAAGSGW